MKPGRLLFTPSRCEICHRNQATIFMVVRDRCHRGKAHVCMNCFEACQKEIKATVESVSLQDFIEAEDIVMPASHKPTR